jgi:uncharacterized membrane protein
MHLCKRGIVFLVGLLILLGIPGSAGAQEEYFRARVLSVEDLAGGGPFPAVEQRARVLIMGGPYAGQEVQVENTYIAEDLYLNIYLRQGMEVILTATGEGEGPARFHVFDVARDRGILYLLLVFLLALLLIGGRKGLKAIVTLVFAALVIFGVILPAILRGYEPISVATMAAIVIIVFTLLVIGGPTRKTLAAVVGTVVGVIVAGILALWVGEISYLTGFSSEEAQMLFYMDRPVDIRGLLFAGIIIGSMGAITDVGMSIASAAHEVKAAKQKIGILPLTEAGLNVGRDIMGTMANTLLLAYVGSATPLLLLIMGYEMPWLQVSNMDLIATEFVRGLAGSVGLFVSVPVTAAAAGLLMGKR